MMSEYSDFKPIDRSRAYTWHAGHAGIKDSPTAGTFDMTYGVDSAGSSAGPSSKKPWSRRNAWGSMSYADLIGKAIESTADKRMTLSQIYDWMIQNVPYFHDKGAGSSSTGWKNSIRHNLSLHRRFKRVPNEDSGKSSWWMLNDAADQCPPTRKRTVSTGKFEGKDLSTDLASPLAKISHVVMEPLQTSLAAGSSSGDQPWLSTVQPLARYGGITTHLPEFSQLKWRQPSAETDPFFVADFDPAFASPSYNTSTSCTPLAPISELLSPQQFTSYDLQAVEIPSPPTYVTVQTVPAEQSAFAGHSLTALSSVPMLDMSSQPSQEMYATASPTELPITEHSSSTSSAKGLQAQGPLWTPGWSMLRQMLSQSHRENAVMHGIINQPSSTSIDNSFSYVTTPQNVHTSDVLYVQMTADLDNASAVQHPVQLTTDDTEGGTQRQSVITGYSDVHAATDVNVPKTEFDNNNENVIDKKSF